MTTATPSTERRSREPRGWYRRRVPWWAWLAAVLVVAIATVALLGGFSRVPVGKVPVIAMGALHKGGEIHSTVTGVSLSSFKPGTRVAADNGDVFLTVEVTMRNVTSAPSSFAFDVVRVIADPHVDENDAPDGVVELRTGDGVGQLQPGLDVPVVFYWQVPADASTLGVKVPIIIGLYEEFPVYGDPVFGDTAFGSPVPTARIKTTITPLPDSATAAEVTP